MTAQSETRILGEKVRALYAQGWPPLVANLVNGGILVTYFSGSVRAPRLLGWSAALVAVVALRLGLWRRFVQRSPGLEELRRWGSYFVAGAVGMGAVWGAAGFVLFDAEDALGQILLTFIVGGMATGAAATLSGYFPALLGFVLPAVLPLVLSMFVVGDELRVTMGLLGFVYGVVLLGVGRAMNRILHRAFSLRFQNEDLVERLSAMTATLEESNRTLEERIEERSRELERQSEALQAAHRREALGRLAGGVAHDFNNLLTVILANASALAIDPRLPEAVRAELEEIELASSRGANLVRQLLAFSGKGRYEPRVVDLTHLVTEARLLLGRLVEAPIKIELELSKASLPVLVDPVQLQQVIMNLATNSRDAMPGGGTLRLETRLGERGGDGPDSKQESAVLVVSDTGIGMDAETLERAFEPFFTTKGPSTGSGLGLSSVHTMVERAGGRVTIEAAPGRGCQVTVTFPLAGGAPGAVQAPAPTVSPVAAASAARVDEKAAAPKMLGTVLLAEDEEIVRTVTRRMLKRLGYAVLVAEDGVQALEIARAHSGKIDLLVTDVLMPRMGGVELAQVLRAERPSLRVLFVSGYERDEKVPAAAPGIGQLRKPFTPEEFGRAIDEMLRR